MIENFKFHVSTAFFLFFAFTVHAQSPADSTSYTREIGFGTNIILSNVFNSGDAPFDFMYRWKSGNGYMRLGTSINFRNEHFAYNQLRTEQFDRRINPEINIGKEWREQITSRWVFNYGVDLNLYYSANKQESKNNLNQQGDSASVYVSRKQEFGPGIRPFVGIMFKINQRLILGTEASFIVRGRRFVDEYEEYTLSNGIRSERDPNDNRNIYGWNFQVYTRPANNIFVYYRF